MCCNIICYNILCISRSPKAKTQAAMADSDPNVFLSTALRSLFPPSGMHCSVFFCFIELRFKVYVGGLNPRFRVWF